MKYKVGDEVYLPDDTFYELYKNTPLKVMLVDEESKRYHFKDGLTFYEDDIDHEKTAELPTDRVVKHYTNDLEKVVAEKNRLDELRSTIFSSTIILKEGNRESE